MLRDKLIPLSGGGIASGMVAGSIAGRIAAESIKENKPDLISTYPKEWYKARGKKHERMNRIKGGMFNFTDEEFNNILDKMSEVPEKKRTFKEIIFYCISKQTIIISRCC